MNLFTYLGGHEPKLGSQVISGTVMGPIGLAYDSRATSFDCGYGPGWSDADELPVLSGSNSSLMVRFGAEQADFFARQTDGSYTAYYGSQDTLVHDTEHSLFVLTKPDGTVYKFYDLDQTDFPQGAFDESVAPSGATVVVTGWTEPGVDGQIAQVEYETTPDGQAYQERAYTYTTDGLDHIASITLQQYDANSPFGWDYVRQITYGYYGKYNGSDELFGLPGDLKTITTQQWDVATQAWTGDDTNYFRYYTDPQQDGYNLLERAILPNSYASFVNNPLYGNPADPANEHQSWDGDDQQTSPIASFTCFYYTYDADRRVASEIVFGKSNESDYVTTINPGDYMVPISGEENNYDYNNWAKKSVETDLNHNTTTVYTNYIGQTLLTDLYDAASGNHTITYNRYDENGYLVLTAEPSAVSDYAKDGNGNWDQSAATPVTFTADGLVYETVYYATTDSSIDGDTAGGAKGYVAYQLSRLSDSNPDRVFETVADVTSWLSNPDADTAVLSHDDYYARWTSTATTYDDAVTAGDSIIYVVADYTTYANADGTGAATTSYAYAWYSGSFQVKEERTTLPVVSSGQNGSGVAAKTFAYYSSAGNLEWSADQNGRFTHYIYDSSTDYLLTTIADVDAGDGYSLPTFTLTGWPSLPASGQGVSAQTDYQYDALGRVTQTLGTPHTADVVGVATTVRTATWTVYLDAVHETRSAQGYAEYNSSTDNWDIFTTVGPISIKKTDRDGRTTDQLQATYAGTVTGLAAATVLQSSYTAWTAYKYQNTRLVGMAVYDDIPTATSDADSDGFIGTSGVNYDKTTYAYENFGSTDKGRQNKTVTPSGTITRYVFDARGNVLQTWIGTHDDGATDTDPSHHSVGQNNDMVLVARYSYDADGEEISAIEYPGGSAPDRTTQYGYDWRDRLLWTMVDDGTQQTYTYKTYDNLGRVIETQQYKDVDEDGVDTVANGQTDDVLIAQSTTAYDSLSEVYQSTDCLVANGTASSPQTTSYWYDAAGNEIQLADPDGNQTTWQYNGLRQATVETKSALGPSEHYRYDAAGELVQTTDRDGRAITYVYDGVGRETSEDWYASVDFNGDPVGSPKETISDTYDSAGRLASISDENYVVSTTATNAYTYDDAGNVLTEAEQIPGLTPTITLSSQYAAGNRTQVAAAIGGTNDFVNNYQYNSVLGQMSQVSQTSNGANAVAAKTATFQYDLLGDFSAVSRYQNADSSANLVAQAAYGYDNAGRLTSLTYTDGNSATLLGYGWTFDPLGNISQETNTRDGTVNYTSDSTGQLLSDGQTNYQYDTNGNRETVTTGANTATYQTGPNNELLYDGTYTYSYDGEGNMTARWVASTTSPLETQPGTGDTDITRYAWDNRNRLTSVTNYATYGAAPSQTVTYIYDALNRCIGETVTKSSGSSTSTQQTRYIYDGNKIVLQFDHAGAGTAVASDLSHRYLWGPAVDQLMADEQVTHGLSQPGDVLWALTDHENSVRDLATYSNGTTTIANHRIYDAYGKLTPDASATVDCLFGYTGRPFDANTRLQNNLNRWYDPTVGRWMSEDPNGYNGGVNLYDYVGDSPLTRTDPEGRIGTPPICAALNKEYTDLDKQPYACKENMCPEELQRRRDIAAKVVALRKKYLDLECDWVLDGSIKKGSASAEDTHRGELANRQRALTKCDKIIAKKNKKG